MNNISEVKNVVRVFQDKNIFDCLVRWNDAKNFMPCSVDLDNPKDLKILADYLIEHHLIINI